MAQTILRFLILLTLCFPIHSQGSNCPLFLRLLADLKKKGIPLIDEKMVRTANKFGTSIVNTDPFVDHFLEQCHGANCVLEIGAGHGLTTSRLLNTTQAQVFINDLSLSNLDTLKGLLEGEASSAKNRVHWQPGRFPEAFSNYPASSFDSILMARVLHFFQPDEFAKALQEIKRLLRPGGSITVTALSPENSHFFGFYPTYLANLRSGNPWPGAYVKVKDFRPNAPLPEYLHLLDPHVLVREFLAAGFKIEKAGYIDRSGQYPGDVLLGKREGVGIIATNKPQN